MVGRELETAEEYFAGHKINYDNPERGGLDLLDEGEVMDNVVATFKSEKHNHYMAKTIQQKLEEIQRLSGNPNLKISDIVDDNLMQAFLNISRKIREEGR